MDISADMAYNREFHQLRDSELSELVNAEE